jgi:hypothetical protein
LEELVQQQHLQQKQHRTRSPAPSLPARFAYYVPAHPTPTLAAPPLSHSVPRSGLGSGVLGISGSSFGSNPSLGGSGSGVTTIEAKRLAQRGGYSGSAVCPLSIISIGLCPADSRLASKPLSYR